MQLADQRAMVDKWVNGLNTLDRARLEKLFTTDFVADWPQSRERIRGVDNLWHIVTNYPGRAESNLPVGETETLLHNAMDGMKLVAPSCTVVSVEGGGNSGVAVWRIHYPDGSHWWVINVYHLRDGLFDRMTSYFAPEYEAPEWRAQWVERM